MTFQKQLSKTFFQDTKWIFNNTPSSTKLFVVQGLSNSMVRIGKLLIGNHQLWKQRVSFVSNQVRFNIVQTTIEMKQFPIHGLLVQKWNLKNLNIIHWSWHSNKDIVKLFRIDNNLELHAICFQLEGVVVKGVGWICDFAWIR